MYISKIKEIVNYRNLSGKIIEFNDKLNFLIGENNIGKTNILELLNIFFSVGKFAESDFTSFNEPIEVKLTIVFDKDELGFFEDNFDIDDSNAITLIAKQDSIDERIYYYHDIPNLTKISTAVIRKMNILYYYAQRMPSKELDFKKTNGSGKVLNYLIQHSLDNNDITEKNILKKTKLDSVIKDINRNIGHLNTATGDKVQACLDSDIVNIISRMLGLGDENGRKLDSLGDGIQYAFNILLQIIEIIYTTKITRKPEDFEERLIMKEEKKFFPLFLVLDEPEVHQHPYRQRNLVKKIKALMENENQSFVDLLKELFGIDGLVGQIFIATHSPNILSNDYKQFIRVFHQSSSDNGISIISGNSVTLDDDLFKHLLRSYVYVKEAMFSKCILFVEGDTEFGAMPVIASRMSLDCDEKGIGIIKLDGANSVKRCMELYSKFEIKTIALIDQDKQPEYENLPRINFTKGIDFEEDIYDNFKFIDYVKYNYHVGGADRFLNIFKRYNIPLDYSSNEFDLDSLKIDEDIQKEIMEKNKESELKETRRSKNAVKSSLMAEYVSEIPSSLKKVINKLKKEVK